MDVTVDVTKDPVVWWLENDPSAGRPVSSRYTWRRAMFEVIRDHWEFCRDCQSAQRDGTLIVVE